MRGEDEDSFMTELINSQYGFKYGAVEVTRITSDEKKG